MIKKFSIKKDKNYRAFKSWNGKNGSKNSKNSKIWLKKKEKTVYKNPFEDKIIEIFYELEAKCGWQKVQKNAWN
ncbi:hypothetical protein [Mesomycoplasma dispar]|uniref:hypothetical protein n=1 Tax=Mesomycoplasma dispar TaxID=86660 RepID=UPI0005CC0F08|nr:hypothetical protein [Mesomycoplasma dispar]AJR12517.1 hypothetical protein MDIS_00710 [Mesomycoplasma dispar]